MIADRICGRLEQRWELQTFLSGICGDAQQVLHGSGRVFQRLGVEGRDVASARCTHDVQRVIRVLSETCEFRRATSRRFSRSFGMISSKCSLQLTRRLAGWLLFNVFDVLFHGHILMPIVTLC